MILYFSATGNSRAVAERLAREKNDVVRPLLTAPATIELGADEALGLVFPVHGWGLPTVVREALTGRNIRGCGTTPYIYCVLTCGDDVGRTDREVRTLFKRHFAREVSAIWSVTMPNTYVVLPGFDVDSPSVEREKIDAAAVRLQSIAIAIRQRRTDICNVHPGALPWTKSHVLGPLFRRFLVTDRIFSVYKTKCNGCGRCAMVCPIGHIVRNADGRPQWRQPVSHVRITSALATHCATCLACYHHCPRRAISCGRFSRGKGQYVFRGKEAFLKP